MILSQSETLIVIPVYNHAKQLFSVVEKALCEDWEVLVVNDGSSENVLLSVKDTLCNTISLPVNTGKGAAIIEGAKWARSHGFKAIITVDADGQLDPCDAKQLLAKVQNNWPAIVVGNRRMTQDTVPKASLFGRKFSNFWVRMECGLDLPDTQSGYRLYPVTELLALPIHSKRYDFEVEVLVRMAWSGLQIFSTPVSVEYPARGERVSHFHQIKDNVLLSILHTKLIIRALNPLPHKKNLPPENDPKARDTSLLHPIKLFKTICCQHASSFQLSVAAWLGVFLGALPLIAVHTIIIIYVSHKLHLNKVAAVAASQFCAPPIVPVICIQVGYFIRNGVMLSEFSKTTLVTELHLRLWEWFLGSLVVGPVLGLIMGLLTYFFVDKFRKASEAVCDRTEA